MAWHDGPKSRPNPLVDAYIEDQEWQQDLCKHVRALALEYEFVTEGIAWGVPFWFMDREKAGFSQQEGPWAPFCYVSCAKAHVTVGIAKGIEVQDRFNLLTGTGKSPIRKLTLKKNADFPEEPIRDYLLQMVQLEQP